MIAVAGGYNLYLCGNGGAKPRHATLFAESISEELCIQYLDRFLMYLLRQTFLLIPIHLFATALSLAIFGRCGAKHGT